MKEAKSQIMVKRPDGKLRKPVKRALELESEAGEGVQDLPIAKRAKVEDGQSEDVDIVDTPERSRHLVQAVLASTRDLLGDSEEEASASTDDDQFQLNVNQEYAQRFEHNKKRKERDQLEAKYGSASSSESDSQSEDEEGEFATEAVDAEIEATLKAIRTRDPRLFDNATKFYTERDDDTRGQDSKAKEKPMYLQDYHRKTLLEGVDNGDMDHAERPQRRSYAQEQAELKRDLVDSMHNAGNDGRHEEDDAEDFLKPSKAPSRLPEKPPIPDVDTADKDPENFLSNYFASRAWVPLSTSRFAHLESDDEDEEQRAEEFEQLYNNRFEDPNELNRTIMTYSRDVVKDKSVRRDAKTSRQRAREREKEHKEDEKRQRAEDRNRLKKLKLEEMEEKIEKIKEASGLSGRDFRIEDWADVLEADFDDAEWDEVMRKRFGEAYYADEQAGQDDDMRASKGGKKKRMPKKPKWDDDIKINDLIPEFDEDVAPDLNLLTSDEETTTVATSKPKSTKAARADIKASQRRERRILEAIADQAVDVSAGSGNGAAPVAFRYREVSPGSFGLTPHDILGANDAELNQFVGLKKLGSFRDPVRKAKDKKKFGKKYRLKMWRREVFGREDGPTRENLFAATEPRNEETAADTINADETVDVKEGKRKKRSRPKKAARAVTAEG